jgi:putative spermidine/putrescine transport system permease protein
MWFRANRLPPVWLALYALAVGAPLLLGLGYSLAYSLGLVGALADGFTWRHWQRLLGEGEALRSLAYSAALAFASLAVSAGLGLAWAYLQLFGQAAWRRLRGWLLLPLAMPPLIAGFAWLYLLSPSGLLSRIGFALGLHGGLDDFPRLVNDAGSVGILAAHVFLVAPFFALYFGNMAEQAQLPALRQLGRTLGAGEAVFVRKIFLPLLLRAGRPMLVLYGIFLFGTYEVPLLLGRQSPQAVTLFITEKMGRFDLSHIPVGHAMAVAYTVLIGLSAWLLLRGKPTGAS